MAYNTANLVNLLADPDELHEFDLSQRKPTIEFRQHGGTLDGQTARKWVETLGGVIKWLEDVHPQSLMELLSVTAEEKWEKVGEGADTINEEKYGPVLAEGRFTIIDLLEHIGLQEQANFYRSRVNKLVTQPRKYEADNYAWSHLEEESMLAINPDFESDVWGYAHKEELREIWYEQMRLKYFLPNWVFDPDATMWPEHRQRKPDE